MTLQIPWALQKVNGGDPDIEYTARLVRSMTTAQLYTEGILGASSFEVHERGAGANFTVEVEAGTAVVDGDDEADQGSYTLQSTAIESVTVDAAPGSNSRLDLVYLQVNDPQAGGAVGSDFEVAYLAGTPAGSPVLPTLPDSAIPLAQIGPVVPSTPSITDSLITDLRESSLLVHPVVDTSQLIDDAVTAAKLADDSVGIDNIDQSSGFWTPFTPALRFDTGNCTKSVEQGGYLKFGKFVIMQYAFTATQGRLGHLNVSLPFTAAHKNAVQGFGYHSDSIDRVYFRNNDSGSTTHAYAYQSNSEAAPAIDISNGQITIGTVMYEAA